MSEENKKKLATKCLSLEEFRAKMAAQKAGPEAGDVMRDGTVFAGISPDTGKPMYAAPVDASPMMMNFKAAAQYARELDVGGKKDFRVPTQDELKVLFDNREKGALKGTFNLSGSYPEGWYWSSTPVIQDNAWVQRFSDGAVNDYWQVLRSRVRCVRG